MMFETSMGWSSRAEARGNGKYESKMAVVNTTTLYSINGIEMRENVGGKTYYTIFWDGEQMSKIDNRKDAEQVFIDFAGITKAKLKKLSA